MSPSTLSNICSSGCFEIGLFHDDSLSGEELAHLSSISKDQLETRSLFLDLTPSSSDMQPPRPSHRSGKPIHASDRAPESRRGAWDSDFHGQQPSTSHSSSSSYFRPVQPIAKRQNASSLAESDCRDSKLISERLPVVAHSFLLSGRSTERTLFHQALSQIGRPHGIQPSTSKPSHRIKGAAAKAGPKLGEGKGKGKAIPSHEADHIDLTGECEEETANPNQLVIDEIFSAIDGTDDDPMRLQGKRIESMEGKHSKINKMSAPASPSVKLKTIKFLSSVAVLDDPAVSVELSMSSNQEELIFTRRGSLPTACVVKINVQEIKHFFFGRRQGQPSQLALEFVKEVDGQDKLKKITKLRNVAKRPDQNYNVCLVEALNESFTTNMQELVYSLPRSKTSTVEQICKFVFPEDPCSDDHNSDPSAKPESSAPRRSVGCSRELLLDPHSRQRCAEKSRPEVIANLSSLPPSVYQKNTNPTLVRRTQKDITKKEDSKLSNSTHEQHDDQQPQQDRKAISSRITRNQLLRSSVQLPGDPRPELALGSSVAAVDSDILLVWPFESDRHSQSVAITRGDLNRLNEGEFLNDTLIEFGLIWELSQIRKRNPELVTSIHLFNSFFFQKLSGCKSKEKTAAVEAAEAYAGVRKWTKGIDVFKKDFLVIPINEHMHWYFMIVSNPGKLLDPQTHIPEANHATFSTPMKTRLSHKVGDSVTKQASPTTPQPPSCLKSRFFGSSPDASKTDLAPVKQGTTVEEMAADDPKMNIAVDNSAQAFRDMDLDDQKSFAHDAATNAESTIACVKNDMELPYVFTLDSLGTAHRPQSTAILRYLINEAKDKLDATLPESLVKSVSIKKVPVPEQPNFCDCGLYLIHAFKTFFKEPTKKLRWILDYNCKKGTKEQRQNEICGVWDAAGAAQARQSLREQILELVPQYQEIVRQRNKAAAEKKEQARTRKLSCTDGPQNSNHNSTKKQRLNAERNDQVISVSSHSVVAHDESPLRITSNSNRLLEKSLSSQSEKDELDEELCNNSQTPKIFSPSPARDQCPEIILDASPEVLSPKDETVGAVDTRPITPDEDLIMGGVFMPSPHTPEDSPSLDQKLSEPRINLYQADSTARLEEHMVDLQSPEPTTPVEVSPDVDGEAMPQDEKLFSSPLSELDSSIQVASPQSAPKSKTSSPEENHAIGSHQPSTSRQAELPLASTSCIRKKKCRQSAPHGSHPNLGLPYRHVPPYTHNSSNNKNHRHSTSNLQTRRHTITNHQNRHHHQNQKNYHSKNTQNNCHNNNNHNNYRNNKSSRNDVNNSNNQSYHHHNSAAGGDVQSSQTQGNSLNPLMVDDD